MYWKEMMNFKKNSHLDVIIMDVQASLEAYDGTESWAAEFKTYTSKERKRETGRERQDGATEKGDRGEIECLWEHN